MEKLHGEELMSGITIEQLRTVIQEVIREELTIRMGFSPTLLRGVPYSEEENQKIIEMVQKKLPQSEMVKVVGRTHSSIASQIAKLRKNGQLTPVTKSWRSHSPNFTKKEDAELVTLYNEGIKIKKIAEMTGRTLRVVAGRINVLRKTCPNIKHRNVTKNTNPESVKTDKRPYNVQYTEKEHQEIIEMHNQGLSHEEIGTLVGRSKTAISYCITKLRKRGYDIEYMRQDTRNLCNKKKAAPKKQKTEGTHVPIVTKIKKKKQGVSLKVKS